MFPPLKIESSRYYISKRNLQYQMPKKSVKMLKNGPKTPKNAQKQPKNVKKRPKIAFF